MTSFQPPYLAEEVVLLLQHLYLRPLHRDYLLLGQIPRPWPAGLVGEDLPTRNLQVPVLHRLPNGLPSYGIDRQAVVSEYVASVFPGQSFRPENTHELGGVPDRLRGHRFHVGA